MKPKLSKKQTLFLEFIEEFIKINNFSPSYREIASGLGYKSLGTVTEHIDNLINLGYLRKADNKARSIELVSDQKSQPLKLIDQIKIRYNQLDELEKSKIDKSFKILNIDELTDLIKSK